MKAPEARLIPARGEAPGTGGTKHKQGLQARSIEPSGSVFVHTPRQPGSLPNDHSRGRNRDLGLDFPEVLGPNALDYGVDRLIQVLGEE